MGAQIRGLNITGGVSERAFLDEINILIGRLKQPALHNVGGLPASS